jgi:hypothetical protein
MGFRIYDVEQEKAGGNELQVDLEEEIVGQCDEAQSYRVPSKREKGVIKHGALTTAFQPIKNVFVLLSVSPVRCEFLMELHRDVEKQNWHNKQNA